MLAAVSPDSCVRKKVLTVEERVAVLAKIDSGRGSKKESGYRGGDF